jgi:alanine dehydrogenase
MPIFLTEREVENLLTMPDALRQVEDALRDFGNGGAQNRPRQRVRAANGVLHVMPAGWLARGYMGFKAYAGFRGGVRFYFHLFDSNTGAYLAILEADKLGQMRTGAASGVATKYLARPDAKSVALLGAGWQAESQLEAVCAVRAIEHVRVFSRDATRRTAFAEKMRARLGVNLDAVDSAERAVRGADIVVTITSAAAPVLQGEWLKQGAHVNAAGSNWAHRREVDSETLKRAHAIFADSVQDAQIESGDLILPALEGVVGWQQVQEISALVAGRATGRVSDDDITFFKSNGIALEDVAVGAWVYERARERDMGIALPF